MSEKQSAPQRVSEQAKNSENTRSTDYPRSGAARFRDPVAKAIEQKTPQAANRQKLTSAESKEADSTRPEIKDLGKAVAFFVEPPLHLSYEAMIKFVNEARKKRIIISPTNEGRKMVGFVESAEQAAFLEQMGDLSLGLVGQETSSFLHIDPQREVTVQGCMSILAAARAKVPGGASRMAQEDDEDAVTGYKNSKLQTVSRESVEYSAFPSDVPDEAFRPIDTEKVKTEHFSKMYAVKIDVNDFGDTFARATKEGQIELDQDLIMFFNQIDKQLKGRGMLVGEQTTDSLELYFPTHLGNKRAVERILAKAIKDHGFSIKAVGTEVKDVELTSYNGRVIHSSKPVENGTWTKKEKLVKQALKDWAVREAAIDQAIREAKEREESAEKAPVGAKSLDEQIKKILKENKRVTREEIESHIFFRYTRKSDKLGYVLPEAPETQELEEQELQPELELVSSSR